MAVVPLPAPQRPLLRPVAGGGDRAASSSLGQRSVPVQLAAVRPAADLAVGTLDQGQRPGRPGFPRVYVGGGAAVGELRISYRGGVGGVDGGGGGGAVAENPRRADPRRAWRQASPQVSAALRPV